jgi:EAL domain-containing protein (putative c-di-GMP-specific phosphodiesterase class I)/CRP-like cAMP-binding protein
MLEQLNREVYAVGEVIFRAGDEGNCAYIVEDGSVEICMDTPSGEQVVKRIGKGELFGEIALIDHKQRTATVRASEKAVLIPIHRKLVGELLEKTDPIVRHLLLLVLERFRGNGAASQRATAATVADKEHEVVQRNKLRGEATQKLAMAHDITRALAENEFTLYYQPICNLGDGKIAGFEALIRWNHPTKGLIPPLDFLWLAEHTGQIREIGLWTLERACRDWPLLRKQTIHPTPFVSVNMSASQLTGEGFVDDVSNILKRYNMPSRELKLELTETVIINNPEQALGLLERLTALKIRLALDDYGTGYSGLDSLQRYPIATMKIDRAFISNMLSSAHSHEIVNSSISLAHSLGMDVIAEGIETPEAHEALQALKCNFGQGWHFGRPAALH